jgi:hypothetical protein
MAEWTWEEVVFALATASARKLATELAVSDGGSKVGRNISACSKTEEHSHETVIAITAQALEFPKVWPFLFRARFAEV